MMFKVIRYWHLLKLDLLYYRYLLTGSDKHRVAHTKAIEAYCNKVWKDAFHD